MRCLLFLFVLLSQLSSYADYFEHPADSVFWIVDKTIQPAAQWLYHQALQPVGEKISDQLHVFSTNQNKQNSPFDQAESNFPSFAKKNYEKIIYGVYSFLKSIPENQLSEELRPGKDVLDHLYTAYHLKKTKMTPSEIELQRTFDEIKKYTLDPDMIPCLRVHLIDIPTENAFNTGCNIFISKELYQVVSQDELVAILAHELGHSAHGDGIHSFLFTQSQFATHGALLWMDEMSWFLTGTQYEHLEALQNGNFLEMVINSIGNEAPAVEKNADIMAVKSLLKAKKNPRLLSQALIKLTTRRQATSTKPSSVRQYPDLKARLDHIEAYLRTVNK